MVGCVELSKVMEVTLEARAGEFADFTNLIEAIKENIRKYVVYMVEGSNTVEEGHRDFAPTPRVILFRII